MIDCLSEKNFRKFTEKVYKKNAFIMKLKGTKLQYFDYYSVNTWINYVMT